MARERDVAKKRVTVVGAARSGIAAARLLKARGAEVFLTDRADVAPDVAQTLGREGVELETGGHTERGLEADLMVVSPGVPSNADLLRGARERGIPVISEIELASWYCTAPIVAITGSNGKTTTTNLLGHVFRKDGRETMVGGNVGYPFADYVRGPQNADVVVLEVSSFQLDEIDSFRPRVAVLLNITPDHLDRYNHDFAAYAASKFRICENQGPGDALVYNIDDEVVRAGVE
ncbi:MAG TPA: Mur ligase family protein, partial [Rhodothermales bacterium]